MKTFDELWKDLEENFDWEKVHKTMSFLEWEWTYDGISGVPQKIQLKNSAKGWLRQCYDICKRGGRRSKSMSCGGFTVKYAEYHDQPEPHNELTLEFVLESFSVW